MFTCTVHVAHFRNLLLLEAHYIRKHLLDSPNLEAFLENHVKITRPTAAR